VHLGRIVGTCTATRKVETLHGYRLLVLQPLTFQREPKGDPLVAVDIVEAARGELVAYVGSREAANSLPEPFNPVDAAIVAIVDDLGTVRGPGDRHLVWWTDEETP
jgi:ethanolamine utilization protein EutN